MHKLPVPIIATIIGRGYSGGALFAGGVADKLLMLQYSVFSVISPEGAAAILLRDAELAKVAAKRMRITAQDSLEFGIIDGIIPEPLAGAHTDFPATIKSVHKALSESLTELSNKYEVAQNTWDLQIIADRRAKYRKMGKFTEVEPETEQTT